MEAHLAATSHRRAGSERSFDGKVHIEHCDGFDCPCYREAVGVNACRHLDILDHFCRVDPALVRERLALAEGPTP